MQPSIYKTFSYAPLWEDVLPKDDLEVERAILAKRWAPPSALMRSSFFLTFDSISLIALARDFASIFAADSSRRTHSLIIESECSTQDSFRRCNRRDAREANSAFKALLPKCLSFASFTVEYDTHVPMFQAFLCRDIDRSCDIGLFLPCCFGGCHKEEGHRHGLVLRIHMNVSIWKCMDNNVLTSQGFRSQILIVLFDFVAYSVHPDIVLNFFYQDFIPL